MAEKASTSSLVKTFERKRPSRKAFPEHLLRERVVIAAPESCPCCRSTRAVEAGRGRHRNAGGDPAPMEGHPDRARAVLLPAVRDDHGSRQRPSM